MHTVCDDHKPSFPRMIVRRGASAIVLSLLACITSLPASAQPVQDPRTLWEQATVYRDEWGVPHIQADNFFAMAFAFGYAQADDHIEGMLKAYRVACGRAAEVYGEAFADSDEFSLKLGHLEAAQSMFPYADEITRDLCAGFALGVNTWLVDHPGDAPDWADGVRPEEILALMHCYLMSFAPFDLPDAWGRAPAATTGNAWALDRSRTTTGETMIAINPHTDYRGPFQWYEAQLTVGNFNAAGATLFGIPTIMQGHNGALGWALTPNFNDFADVYLEPGSSGEVDPSNPASVFANRDSIRYMQMVANSRTYFVRQPGGMEERQIPYLDTEHGPIIGKHKGRFATYQIGGYRDFGALRQFHLMASAQNLQQFQSALELHQLPCFHVVYADREGNIFYLYNTKVGAKYWPGPVGMLTPTGQQDGEPNSSPRTVNWALPVPGGSSIFAWGAVLPPSALPSLTNPSAGYIQACGNPPWTATERADLSADQWPGWFAPEGDTFRAQRARRLLALGRRSFEDVQGMLYDVVAPAAMYAVPWLKQTAEAHREEVLSAHPDLAPCIEGMFNWNYVAETNSPGMTYFHVWWTTLRSMTQQYNDVELVKALGANSKEIQEAGLRAAEEAAMLLRSEFQTLNVPWGDVHTFVRGGTTMPAPGGTSGQPLFLASDEIFEDNAWRVTYGYGFAMVVAFGPQRTRAASMTPFGASENPESPHFADQMKLVQDRRMKQAAFDPAEVRRLAASAYGSKVRIAPPGLEAECTVSARDPIAVSTEVFTEPPAPLPSDLATYTVYARIVQEPVTVPSALDMQIYVAPELCAAEYLPYLAVWAYDSDRGWARLEAQEVNAQTRVFTCRDRGSRTYAVLGPENYRPAPDVAARTLVAQTIPEQPAEPRMPAIPAVVEQLPAPPPVSAPLVPSHLPATTERPDTAMPAQSAPPLVAAAANADSRVRQGAITWGSSLRLQPPNVDGLFEMHSEAAFGARLIAFEESPAPLPDGLAAFTEFVMADCQSAKEAVELTVHLRVQQDVCAPDSMERLSLYALSPQGGWEPLPEQNRDASKRQFTAKDTTPRTYAVLGPQALRLKAPGPLATTAVQRPQ